MATDTGIKLLSALRKAGSTSALRDVPESFFEEGDERDAFKLLLDHVENYRAFPNPATFRAQTGITLVKTNEPVRYYVDQARKRLLYTQVMEPFAEFRDCIEGRDPDRFVEVARRVVAMGASLSSTGTDYITLQSAMAEVETDYHASREILGLRGIPTAWDYVNDITDGWQNDDLVTFVGRPGVGKTYLLLMQAYAAWMAGYSVLFSTNELSGLQLARRLFGIHTKVNPRLVRSGRLSSHVHARIGEMFSGIGENGVPFNIIQGGLRKTVDTIRGVAEATEPDIIIADAAYLMKPAKTRKNGDSRRETIGDVIEDLKRINLDLGRPMLLSVQFGRTAEKRSRGKNEKVTPVSHLGLANIGETDIIGQVSSLVVGAAKPFSNQPQDHLWCKFLKGREGEGGTFTINYSFEPVDFSFRQEVNEEVEEAERSPEDLIASNPHIASQL